MQRWSALNTSGGQGGINLLDNPPSLPLGAGAQIKTASRQSGGTAKWSHRRLFS